jgi:hypothetical protein
MTILSENQKEEQETWRQSLKRLWKVNSLAIERAKEIEDEGYGTFTVFQLGSEEVILSLEVSIGFSMPSSLRELLLTHGPFQVGTSGVETTFEIFCTPEHKGQSVKKFWDLIDEELTGSIRAFFTSSEIDELNKGYFIFGKIFLSNDNHEYLYFTNEGLFGTLIFYHDDDSGPTGLKQMIEKRGNFFDSLDKLFSYCVDLKIDRIKKWIEDHESR